MHKLVGSRITFRQRTRNHYYCIRKIFKSNKKLFGHFFVLYLFRRYNILEDVHISFNEEVFLD